MASVLVRQASEEPDVLQLPLASRPVRLGLLEHRVSPDSRLRRLLGESMFLTVEQD